MPHTSFRTISDFNVGLKIFEDKPKVVTYGSRIPWVVNTFSDGTETTETSKFKHIAVGNISNLRVEFANFPGIAALLTDTNPSVAFTLSASVEYPAGVFTDLTFNRSLTYLLSLREIVLSDLLPLCPPDGASFWVWTNVTVTSGQKWVRNQATDLAFGEGVSANVTLSSAKVAGITSSSTYCFGPSRVLGTSTTNKGSVLWIGDSISVGQNDSGFSSAYPFLQSGGIYNRAFLQAYPGIIAGVAGQRASYYNPVLTAGSIGNFSSLLSGVHFAICNLGINDFGANTAVQLEQLWLNLWAPLKAQGIGVFQGTLTPKVTTTDGGATTGNQTVTASEAVRVSGNGWLRDGAPYDYTTLTPSAVGATGATIIRIGSMYHCLQGIIEFADVVETSRNSGIWKAPSYTTDGTHGTSTSYPLLSAAINLTNFKKY